MARYIDADKLIEHLLKLKVVTDDMYGMGIARGIERAETAIQMQPTADVVPKSEVIPCKIGDTVWGITKYSGGLTQKARKGTVSTMFFLDDMRLCIVARGISRGEWGKEIFATKEEAEATIERCGQ